MSVNQGEPPLAQFRYDWTQAQQANDPHAPFGTLATVTDEGFPTARVVTLREVNVEAGTFLIFSNDACPKYRQLEASSQFELVFFWTTPSMIQYRVRGNTWKKLDDMKERWTNKPKSSQLLDYYYTHHQPQSSVCRRDEFLDTMQHLKEEFADREVPFQSTATGIVLEPNEIEEWRGSVSDRLHERYLHRKTDTGQWQKHALVP